MLYYKGDWFGRLESGLWGVSREARAQLASCRVKMGRGAGAAAGQGLYLSWKSEITAEAVALLCWSAAVPLLAAPLDAK